MNRSRGVNVGSVNSLSLTDSFDKEGSSGSRLNSSGECLQ